MAPVDHKTMFEIYREQDYNRAFRCVFFTELDEHNRGKEIARAAAGETIFSGFVSDDNKEDARAAMYEEINRDLQAEYLPALPISHSPPAIVVAGNVQGLITSPLAAEDFSTVYLED